jgi:hypothetical protein
MVRRAASSVDSSTLDEPIKWAPALRDDRAVEVSVLQRVTYACTFLLHPIPLAGMIPTLVLVRRGRAATMSGLRRDASWVGT